MNIFFRHKGVNKLGNRVFLVTLRGRLAPASLDIYFLSKEQKTSEADMDNLLLPTWNGVCSLDFSLPAPHPCCHISFTKACFIHTPKDITQHKQPLPKVPPFSQVNH